MVKVVDDEQDAANAERHAAASAGLKLGIVRLGRAGGKVRHGTRVNFYYVFSSRLRLERVVDGTRKIWTRFRGRARGVARPGPRLKITTVHSVHGAP